MILDSFQDLNFSLKSGIDKTTIFDEIRHLADIFKLS